MPRKKLSLAYITNGGARTATLKKRRASLLKKAQELAVLCDVPACAVLYTPGESAPVVWPSPEVAMSLCRKINSTEGILKGNNTMNREKLYLKQLEKVRAEYSRVIAENAELSGEVVLRGIVSGRPVSNLDFHELQSVSAALARRAQAVDTWIRRMAEVSGECALLTPPPPLLTPSVQAAFESSWINGVGEAALPGCDQPEIYSVQTWTDDFDPAEWDLLNIAPLFSLPTVESASEIDEALQHQRCSEGGGDDAQAAYDFTDNGGDGTSADMFTSESETELGLDTYAYNSLTWDDFLA